MLFRLQLHSGTDVALFRSVAAALTYVALGLQFNPNYPAVRTSGVVHGKMLIPMCLSCKVLLEFQHGPPFSKRTFLVSLT